MSGTICSVKAVTLRRDGSYAAVDLELANGDKIEVIRELANANFYHVVTADGIAECLQSYGTINRDKANQDLSD